MSVRTKIIIIVFGVFTLFVAVDYLVLSLVIQPRFAELETRAARQDMARVRAAIDLQLDHLRLFCADWSQWDDTYAFIEDGNQEFIDGNLVDSSFVDNHLNVILFADDQGGVAWQRTVSLPAMEDVDLGLAQNGKLNTALLGHLPADLEKGFSGFARTPRGLLMFSAQPITTSDKQGPVRGLVIMGRRMDETFIATISRASQVPMGLRVLGQGPAPPAPLSEVVARLEGGEAEVSNHIGEGVTAVYTLLRDHAGEVVGLLTTKTRSGVAIHGDAAVGYALASMLAAAFVVMGLLTILINRTVVSPLTKLTNHVINIGRKGLGSERLDFNRNDELGVLAGEFDRMFARLGEMQSAMLEQSYFSGLADMNAGVLHNIGNAISPIIVHLSQGLERLSSLPLENMAAAERQLADDAVDPDRRAQLEEYLVLANAELRSMVPMLIEERQEALAGIARIENILVDSRFRKDVDRPLEDIRLDQLVREALGLVDPALRRQASFRLGHGLVSVGTVRGHRVPLMQILGNLLANAAEAIVKSSRPDGVVDINADLEDSGGVRTVHISVRDNGVGIAAEDLQQLFQRGVSTKGGASAGLGLHWSANAASNLGGRLYAQSAGPGQGASFHLLLPIGNPRQGDAA